MTSLSHGEAKLAIWPLLIVLVLVTATAQVLGWQQPRDEEREDHFRRWLEQDVVYIITPEEKAVFEKLTTDEEKEQFIEQFWLRRDPDPATNANEFREEHYRRIAYANEKFRSGVAGWMTDRGKVYIIHGPPAEIQSRPAGGLYNRPLGEGGGSTAVFPFETWRYRHIEGMGNDVVIEFVDPSMTGEFRLAIDPNQKDALLYVPGGGMTLAEELGWAEKRMRPFFEPANEFYPFMRSGAEHSAFERYERYVNIQRPVELKNRSLQEFIDVNVRFDKLPFRFRDDYFRLNQARVIVPLTVELDDRELTFAGEASGAVARIGIYGIVSDLGKRVVAEFGDDVQSKLYRDASGRAVLGKSVYQKTLVLEAKGRYRLDLVVEDRTSSKIGLISQALIPPSFPDGELNASSLLLTDFVRQLEETPKEDQMFVLGDLWIRPSLERSFSSRRPLFVYFQLYNLGLDQSSGKPALKTTYRIFDQSGKNVFEVVDEDEQSLRSYSDQRVVLLRRFNLGNLAGGTYALEVEAEDRITGGTVKLRDEFRFGTASDQAGGN